MKNNVHEYCLYKGSLNIPEYRCLLIGRVQSLYTIEHAVENIAYYRCYSISVTLLSLDQTILKYYYQIAPEDDIVEVKVDFCNSQPLQPHLLGNYSQIIINWTGHVILQRDNFPIGPKCAISQSATCQRLGQAF